MNLRPRQFVSDNQSGICPEAMDAIVRSNGGHQPSYGEDSWTSRAARLMRELFETDCVTHLLFNGTAANSLALASLGRSYNAVVCAETAHIETSECGAPQFFSGGMKLLTCPAPMGKIDLPSMERHARGEEDPHSVKPRVLSVTQSTELGTTYSLTELAVLFGRAKTLNLLVHMDGARFANAVASLGCTPAELTWKLGVDVLSFGGTKNGTAMCEAVVFFDRALSADFAHRALQGGQVASKMRFMAAQWVAMLESGAWLRYARHANAMARRLEVGLRKIDGVRVLFPVNANAVFVDIPLPIQARIKVQGWNFYAFVGDTGVRLMCSWDTAESDVDQFVDDVRKAF